MCQRVLLFAAVFGCVLGQFTSFVPQYTVQQPSSFEYGSYPYRNFFDPYTPTKNAPSTSFFKDEAKEEAAGGAFGFGDSIFMQGDAEILACEPPRVYIAGICRCPFDGIFLSGICFPRSRYTSFCDPPRLYVNGECSCPNQMIFTSSGNCIREDTSYVGDCKFPRKIVNGVCSCPDNAIFLSGECFVRDDQINYPTEPIGNIRDPDSISGLALIFRNYDGAKNNLNNPLWGSKGSLLERRAPANYEDGRSKPISNLPNPRAISNYVGNIDGHFERSTRFVTMAFVIWGQFLDHDIDLTTQGNEEPFDIPIPFND